MMKDFETFETLVNERNAAIANAAKASRAGNVAPTLEKREKLYKREQMWLIRAAILRNNARLALDAAVFPAAVRIWNKYAGKPWKDADATGWKVACEVLEATGCNMHVVKDRHGFLLSPADRTESTYDIVRTLGTNLCVVDEHNTIQPVNIENTALAYVNMHYYADVDDAAKQIVKAWRAAVRAHEAFVHACNNYTFMTVEGLRDAGSTGYLYGSMPL